FWCRTLIFLREPARPIARRGLLPGMPSRSGAGPSYAPWPLHRIVKDDLLLVAWRWAMLPKAKRRLLLGAVFAKLLLPQTQLLDQCVIPLDILLLEVCEQAAALVDHHQQAAARMVVLVVILEMLGEVADPFGQDRDLHFGRSRVVLVTGIALDNLLLLFGGNRHLFTPRYPVS